MKNSPTQGTFELEVKNFGPIAKAKIDLRPLTVFVGPSNTGKSYLAILIYALHRYFGVSRWPRYSGLLHALHGIRADKLSKEVVGAVNKIVKQMFEDKDGPRFKKGVLFPAAVTNIIRDTLEEDSGSIRNEISRCFGTKAEALIRKRSKGGARVDLRWYNTKTSAPIAHQLEIDTQMTRLKTIIPEDFQFGFNGKDDDFTFISLYETATEVREGKQSDRYARRLLHALLNHAFPQIAGLLGRPAYYLPADRTGVMHAHKVVVRALIERAAMTGLHSVSGTQPVLSGVLADFLEELIEIEPYQHPDHRQNPIVMQIEEAILGGSVEVDKSEINYPSFTYKPKGWEKNLPLMNASSMVSELAPVVLYLRHIIDHDNVLIVEEPEAHLHPAMQVEFIRQLAEVVKSGVRIIITTHSEWVLEELANIVLRSRSSEANRKKEGTGNGYISLQPDQVGAWLFQPKSRPKGSMVREITLENYGLYESGFDEVARELYNEWIRISD